MRSALALASDQAPRSAAARFGTFLIGAALTAGCGFVPGIFPAPSPPIASTRIDAKGLLARLDARERAIRSLRALARMEYRDPQERITVREAILVERPDHLRIEMISTFGVALQITADGERLRAYHRGERTFYGGSATAANLARFTRLNLDVAAIADLLVGLPPGRPRSDRPDVEFEEPTGLWRVTAPLVGGGLQFLWFDHDRLLAVRSEEVDRNGTRLYLTAYGDYRDVDGVPVPHEIELHIPAQDTHILLTYADVTVNRPVKRSLFSFDPPPGSKIVDLDEP